MAMAHDAELCARVGRALALAMAGRDYVHAQHVRGVLTDIAVDTELRVRARDAIEVASRDGDLVVIKGLCDALEECDAYLTSWRKKVMKFLEPPVEAG